MEPGTLKGTTVDVTLPCHGLEILHNLLTKGPRIFTLHQLHKLSNQSRVIPPLPFAPVIPCIFPIFALVTQNFHFLFTSVCYPVCLNRS